MSFRQFITLALIFFGVSAFADESSMMSEPQPNTDTGSMMMMSAEKKDMGGKVTFTTLEDAEAFAAAGPTVLFFAADWCPTCKAALKDIDANLEKLRDVTIVVVNYDKETSLKKKYGISYQHTFVRIDKDGKKLEIWSGGGVDTILKKISVKEAM